MRILRAALVASLVAPALASADQPASLTDTATPVANACGQPGVIDSSVCALDPNARVAVRVFGNAGGVDVGSGNEFGESRQAVDPPQQSAASYERVVYGYCAGGAQNPSVYGLGQRLYDLVCFEAHALNWAPNTRVWGYHVTAGMPLGVTGPGYSVGYEIESQNAGDDQPDPGVTSAGHYGMNIIADGPNPSTAAIHVMSGGGRFHHGVRVDANAVAPGGSGISLGNAVPIIADMANGSSADVFYVNPGNSAVIGGPGMGPVMLWNGTAYVPAR